MPSVPRKGRKGVYIELPDKLLAEARAFARGFRCRNGEGFGSDRGMKALKAYRIKG